MSCTAFKKNVYRIVKQRGKKISISFDNQSTVTTNDFGDPISEIPPSVYFYAFPVELNPSAKIRERHGIETPVDVVVYLSMYEIEKKGYTALSFQPEHNSMDIFGQRYKVDSVKEYSHCEDGFLYLVLSGNSDSRK